MGKEEWMMFCLMSTRGMGWREGSCSVSEAKKGQLDNNLLQQSVITLFCYITQPQNHYDVHSAVLCCHLWTHTTATKHHSSVAV